MDLSNIKLVVVDMDGTFLVSHHDTSERNLNALLSLQQKGIKVAIASGRPLNGLTRFVERLQLKEFGGFCVGNNGQEIYFTKDDNLIRAAKIPFDIAYQSILFGIKHQLQIFGFNGTKSFFYDPAHSNGATINGKTSYFDEREFVNNKEAVDKIGLFIENNQAKHFAELLNQQLNGAIQVLAVNDRTVEIVPHGVDKVEGIHTICKEMGYNPENVLVFGDGQNDIRMMSCYPSVAMGNAYDEVKEISMFHTKSNTEDGVAHFLELNLL